MIDTHCHLDQPAFDADREAVLARARAAGVTDVIVPAIGPDRWERLAALAAATPGVHLGLGIHPQLLPELDPAGDGERLERLGEALAARKPALAAQAIPRDRLLLETDAPDQTPRPHRGRNEPALLAEIAAGVARALGTSVEEVDAVTSENARGLFGL